MSDNIDRAELRRLHAAAPEGRWEAERVHHRPDGKEPHWCWEVTVEEQAFIRCIRENELDARETAELIAKFRTAVPALLDALEQAEAERDRAFAKIDRMVQKWARERELAGDALRARQEAQEQAEARIQAVRELHQHGGAMFGDGLEDHTHVCASCLEEWPCPTIRALDA